MDNSLHESTFYLGTSACDVHGLWKVSSMMEVLQCTANEHSSKMKRWYTDLKSLNLSLVLYKSCFKVERFAALGESVTVRTYTKGVRSLFCPRYFIVYDEDRKIIAKAGSLMILMDRSSRKSILPKKAGVEFPDAIDIEPSIKIPLRKKEIQGDPKVMYYQPQYSDVDINGHVNNVRYLEWLCNAIGFDLLNEYVIDEAVIDYNNEILPSDMIKMSLIIEKGKCPFRFYGQKDNRLSFDIFGNLRLR